MRSSGLRFEREKTQTRVSQTVGFGTKTAANEFRACRVPLCCPTMEGMKYGYARISTEDQNAAMQHTALKQAGCKTSFTDELSGAITKRPALLRCMKKLERGDTLGFVQKKRGNSTGWAAACAT